MIVASLRALEPSLYLRGIIHAESANSCPKRHQPVCRARLPASRAFLSLGLKTLLQLLRLKAS